MRDEQRIINLILESIYEMSEADKPKKGQSGLSRAFKRGNLRQATCHRQEISVDEVNAIDPELGISQQVCWGGVPPARIITKVGQNPNYVKNFINNNQDLLNIDSIIEKYGENFSVDDFMEKYFHPNETIRSDFRNIIAHSPKFEKRQENKFGKTIKDRETKFILFRPLRDVKDPATGKPIKSHKNEPGWLKYIPILPEYITDIEIDPTTGEKKMVSYGASELRPEDFVRDELGVPIIELNKDSPNYLNYIMKPEDDNKQVAIWLEGDNPEVDPPSLFIATDDDGREFLYHQLQCYKTNEEDNRPTLQEKLNDPEFVKKLNRVKKNLGLNILFLHSCRKATSGIQSQNVDPVGQFIGMPGEPGYGKAVDYPEDVVYPSGKRRTEKKDDVSKTIKMSFNKIIAKEFAIKGPTFNLFESKSLPPIVFDTKHMNTYTDKPTYNKILYQGINTVDYGSKETLVRKIFNRATGKKYDQALVKTVLENNKTKELNIGDINIGDKIRFDVYNIYSGPRQENAVLRLYAVKGGPVEKLSGTKVATTATTSGDIGYGKQNWIQGKIVSYDNKRNRITIEVTKKQGIGFSSTWMIEYGDVSMFYEPRQFNKKYRRWSPDRAIQFEKINLNDATDAAQTGNVEFSDETKSRFKGVTPIYGLGRLGYRDTDPEVTFRMLWEIAGERQENTFDWSMLIKTQMGIKDPRNPTGNVIFQPFKYGLSDDNTAYQLDLTNPNGQIYNDGMITSEVSVDLDEMVDFDYDGTWICIKSHVNSTLNKRIEENTLISTEEFESLSPTERENFRVYTIMDNYKVRLGLEQLIEDIKSKVEALDPQQALLAVNPSEESAQRVNVQEQLNNIVRNIIREIKQNK